jgi:predicted acetyltransferase
MRVSDSRLVEMIDIRYVLTDFLRQYGGNIGYSVRLSERWRGYATEMLRLLLAVLARTSLERVLLCCDPANVASKKVIENCGGELENTVDDEPGLGGSGKIERHRAGIGRKRKN